MTVEQRLDRIEQLHADQMELAKQDRVAYIAWKRDMESQVQATWKAIERYAEENRKGFADTREAMAEMRKEMTARDQVTDKRIGDLVSAIGELIKRMDRKS